MKEIDFSKYEDMLGYAASGVEEASTDGKTRPGGTICSVCGTDRHQEVIRQMERDHVSEDMERETFYE